MFVATMPSLLATIALLASAAPLHAQTEWEQQVRERLRGAERMLADSGYQQVAELQIGELPRRDRTDHTVNLQAGGHYFIVAACDDDCSDLDLQLLDAEGVAVAEDVGDDPLPAIAITAARQGPHAVRVVMVGCSTEPCVYGLVTYARFGAGPLLGAGGVRTEHGELVAGDELLTSGELYDEYRFDGVPGQTATIELRSKDFDTYLIVWEPTGRQHDNDDAEEGNTNRSVVAIPLTTPGEYRINVTSFRAGERGRYDLTIKIEGVGGYRKR
jgi:hypothetical protein